MLNVSHSQVSVMFATDLVCPAYHTKFAAINNTLNDYEDFRKTLNDAFVSLKQNYTAKVSASVNEFSSEANATTKITINELAEHAFNGIAEEVVASQMMLDDVLQDSQSTELKFMQSNIDMICDQVEFAMRIRLEMLLHHYLRLTNRQSSNSTDKFELITRPDGLDATIKSVVGDSARSGNSPDKMYADGITAVYEPLHAQINDYIDGVNITMRPFEENFNAQPTETSANETIQREWMIVQEYKKKVMNFELPKVAPLKDGVDANMTRDALVDRIVDKVSQFYSDVLYDVHELAGDLSTVMTSLEYKLKQSTKVTVNGENVE